MVDQEDKNNGPAANPAAHASDPDRRLHHAHAQHGPKAIARPFHAAADAGHPHFGLRFHAGARGAKSRLGIFAAVRRRADRALWFSDHHGGGRAALCRRPGSHGGCERLPQRHDWWWRADRHITGLYGGGHRDVGGGPRGARVSTLDGARPGVGCGIARRAAVGADRADAQRRLRLADGSGRLRGAVTPDDSGGLVRGQGGQDSATQASG